MDPKLFQEQLEQYAEVKPMKPPTGPSIREAGEPEEIIRNGHKLIITKKDNPSWPYQIKKLKSVARECEDCSLVVKDRVVEIKYLNYPQPHRKETCTSCRMTLNPETRGFDLPDYKVASFFASYYRKSK